jgi:hypothetical protein
MTFVGALCYREYSSLLSYIFSTKRDIVINFKSYLMLSSVIQSTVNHFSFNILRFTKSVGIPSINATTLIEARTFCLFVLNVQLT